MLHDEADGIAAFATAEAFINFFGWGNGKRRRFFIMKRAESEVAGAPLFQLHKPADHIHNVDAAEYLLYGILRDQYLRGCNLTKAILNPDSLTHRSRGFAEVRFFGTSFSLLPCARSNHRIKAT